MTCSHPELRLGPTETEHLVLVCRDCSAEIWRGLHVVLPDQLSVGGS